MIRLQSATMANGCPLCDVRAGRNSLSDRDSFIITCDRCGKFEISGIAERTSLKTPEISEKRYLLSGRTRNFYESYGTPFLLTNENLEQTINSVPRNVVDKRLILLKYLANLIETPGRSIMIDTEKIYPIAYCMDEKELNFYLGDLHELKFINDMNPLRSPRKIILKAKGWEEIDRLQTTPIDSNQVFLAMKFPKKDSTDDIDRQLLEACENGFILGIKDTGHDFLKIDEKQHNRKICEEILYEIKQSKFLVADVTGQRGGVYFEAGYALALGKEVVWTCHESEKDVHFDARQYNRITWKSAKDLRNQLKNRIFGSVGRGKNEVKPD